MGRHRLKSFAFASRTAAHIFAVLFLLTPSGVMAQSRSALASLEKRVVALEAAGKYAEAIPLAEQLVLMNEAQFGKAHTATGNALNTLADLYRKTGRYADAEQAFKRCIALEENAHGPSSPDLAWHFNNLAILYVVQGRYSEAEPLYRLSLSIREKVFGAEHSSVAQTLNNLANLLTAQGRYVEAERTQRRSLAIWEKTLEHSNVAGSLGNLAYLLQAQGRYAEAEPLYKRCLAVWEKAFGPWHPNVANALNNLAETYRMQSRYVEAEPLYRRSLAIYEKAFGADHPNVGGSLNNLGNLLRAQGQYVESERVFRRSLAIWEKALGNEHPNLGLPLNSLAGLYEKQGRYSEAEPLRKRRLTIAEKALGPDHPDVSQSLSELGYLELQRKHWSAAYDAYRRATTIQTARALRGEKDDQGWRYPFYNLVSAAWGFGVEQPTRQPDLARESFEAAQWGTREASGLAVTQMAARFGAGSSGIAQRVRQQQDLDRQRQELGKSLLAAVSSQSGQRNDTRIADLRRRLAAVEAELAAHTQLLEREFPNYAELTSPRPLALTDAQALLAADEALVFFLPEGDGETFVWAITKSRSDWRRIPLDDEALAVKVATLRRGVDLEDAEKVAQSGGLFDLQLAYDLYSALLGPVLGVIKDKQHLLVVPSASLTSLPFQLLVTDKPAEARSNAQDLSAYRKASWLIKRHAITVLPSVSSLRALRVLAKAHQAAKPLVGFGDPVFGPNQSSAPRASEDFKSATRSTTRTRSFSSYWHGTEADLDALRVGLSPLPETAVELKSVARQLGASEDDIRLGPAASEATVKQMDLSPYRVVYFATHGLVAGELRNLAEPALALTIPKEPTPLDDGLLTASEVAQLKLNADWVVLSACNTAAGDKPGAEALSGLARAFFYAGARAILVSHWRVDSVAAVRLTTGAFQALQREPTIGRAEALRRAMLAYMNDPSSPWNAYPDYWGPFSIVGEGGRSEQNSFKTRAEGQ